MEKWHFAAQTYNAATRQTARIMQWRRPSHRRTVQLYGLARGLTIIHTPNPNLDLPILNGKLAHRLLQLCGTFTSILVFYAALDVGDRTGQMDRQTDRQTGKTRTAAYKDGRTITLVVECSSPPTHPSKNCSTLLTMTFFTVWKITPTASSSRTCLTILTYRTSFGPVLTIWL